MAIGSKKVVAADVARQACHTVVDSRRSELSLRGEHGIPAARRVPLADVQPNRVMSGLAEAGSRRRSPRRKRGRQPDQRDSPASVADAEAPATLPFLPVLLVVCENWELHFAFDRGGQFEVCGPLEIGSTMTVDGSYRLLAVLRLLAGWVAGGFRGWVEQCVA